TLGATGKLQGYGTVFQSFGGAQLVNNGTIAADSVGNTLALNNSVITNHGNISVLATLSVGGSLTQLDAGSHTSVDGILSLAQTFVVSGGLLSGIGTIQGNVNNSAGRVAPGDSPGLLTITGNYSQASDAVFDVELGGTSPGSAYDQLSVSGSATLAGGINV